MAEAVTRISVEAPCVPVTQIEARVVNCSLDNFVVGGSPGKQVAFQRIDLSPSVLLLGGSAEFVVQYALDLRAHVADHTALMPIGCLDDCFGYVPTAAMLEEGGYEAGGFCSAFGYSNLAPTVASQAKSALMGLISPDAF